MKALPTNIVDFYAENKQPKALTVQAGPLLSMLEVHLPAHREPDNPPIDDLVLIQALSSFDCLADNGLGAFLHNARKDDFFIVPPKVVSRVELYTDSRIRVVATPFAQASRLLEREAGIDELRPLSRFAFRDEWLAGLLDRLWSMAAQQGHTRLLGDESVALILFALRAQLGRRTSAPKGRLAPWQVNRMVEYMMAHLSANVSLFELASLIDLSSFHVARAFKATTGEAPHEMHMRLRMARAKELLCHTNDPVGDIAAAVGFGQTSHFARAFGRVAGVTPSEYRRKEK